MLVSAHQIARHQPLLSELQRVQDGCLRQGLHVVLKPAPEERFLERPINQFEVMQRRIGIADATFAPALRESRHGRIFRLCTPVTGLTHSKLCQVFRHK